MVRVMVLTALLALGLAGCTKKPPAYDMTLTMKDLMAGLIDPQAQVFWHSSGSIDDEKGSHSLVPATEEGWAAAENSMTAVAEAGNLLLMPGRARDDGDWVKFSKQMTQLALQGRAATKARDGDKMFATGAALYDACQACHQKYLLPFIGPDGKLKPEAQTK